MLTAGTEQVRYHWAILQSGQLPLEPDGHINRASEHRCACVLIWPEGAPPTPNNTVMVDPCFTERGQVEAVAAFQRLAISFANIGRIFITHPHGDHLLFLPGTGFAQRFGQFWPGEADSLTGIRTVHCPGHHPVLLALDFVAVDGRRVWVMSDAILNEGWLRAWGYYWPNGYTAQEVIETWRSVAKGLSQADVIVPGHGAPIPVTAALIEDLLAAFPNAPHASACPDVAETLAARLAHLKAGNPHA
jgi:glyoxylase-like metal-dependent hydrolase (beta-lactamase superfamily II)